MTLPWDRTLLSERTPAEQRRLLRWESWYRAFQDSAAAPRLGEVTGYTVAATTLDRQLHSKAVELGRPIGFGPLIDDDTFPVLALIPYDRPPLSPYRYVRILGGKRHTLVGSVGSAAVLVVDDFEELPGESVWLDPEIQPAELPKVYAEGLRLDPPLVRSLLAPIVSAPASELAPGGLSIASFQLNSRDRAISTLLSTLTKAAPPEFLDLPRGIPYKGVVSTFQGGVRLHYAQRPPSSRHTVKTFHRPQEPGFGTAFDRGRSGQETSILGALRMATGDAGTAFGNLMLEAHGRADMLYPERLDTLAGGHTDLRAFERSVHDERVFKAVVQARQINPSLGSDLAIPRLSAQVFDEIDTAFMDIQANAAKRKPIVGKIAEDLERGTIRTALQQARLAGHEEVRDVDLQAAWRLQKALIHHFWEVNPQVRSMRLDAISEPEVGSRRDRTREQAVRTQLQLEPGLQRGALWAKVRETGHFEDEQDLVKFLDKLRKSGKVYLDGRDGWHWVA